MQPAAPEISTCPDCGQTLEETSGGKLGCIACLLRTGISGEDDLPRDSNPDAFEGDGHFGVYRVDRRDHESLYKLGHGGMGTTYRATDMSLQRKVALKIITLGIAGRSREVRERFLREARAAAAVRHENIATVFQFGIREETGQCFYAMELIEGETLEERVQRAGPLDTRTTIFIAQQVTAALAAAERRGWIHCDLKPANLMLVDSDESQPVGLDRRARRERTAQRAVPVAKIIDFGLAKALHAPIAPMRLTYDGFLGTPAFASPEQFENSALDMRSDIYSLGVTLWFALTGKTPFAGRSVEEIHRAQQSNVLPIGQLKSAQVPSRLRLLLKSMLALDPAARPGPHKLAVELRRCAAQATGARRTRVVLAAAATLIPVASAAFVFHSLRTHSAPPSSAATLIPVASAAFVFHSPRTHSAPPSSGLNPAPPEKSHAALTFENLSREPDSAFLAHGVHDDVLTKLADIADLKIISRTSVMRYSDKEDVPEGLAERDPRAAAASAENVFGDDTVHFNQIFIDSVVARTATTPAPFVEIDQNVIPTMKRYRASPQTAQVRSQYKRINRKRTLWDKLRYGWASKHPYPVKKK
jgi:serine/threonine protein kinase